MNPSSLLHAAYPNAEIHVADKDYECPTEERLWDELVTSYFEDYEYLKETLDCDDYALLLHAWIRQKQYKEKWGKPLAFGEAWSKTHAVNIAILNTGKVVLIEPQNDRVLDASTYGINFVRM